MHWPRLKGTKILVLCGKMVWLKNLQRLFRVICTRGSERKFPGIKINYTLTEVTLNSSHPVTLSFVVPIVVLQWLVCQTRDQEMSVQLLVTYFSVVEQLWACCSHIWASVVMSPSCCLTLQWADYISYRTVCQYGTWDDVLWCRTCQSLSQNCQQLRQLNLESCAAITDFSLISLRWASPDCVFNWNTDLFSN